MSKIILNLLIVFIIQKRSQWIYAQNRQCQKVDFNRPTSVVNEFGECPSGANVLKINPYSNTIISPFRPNSAFHLAATDEGPSCLQSTSIFSLDENSEIRTAIFLSLVTSGAWVEIQIFDMENGRVDVVASLEESTGWVAFSTKLNRTIADAQVEIRADMNANSTLAIEYIFVLNSLLTDDECIDLETEMPTEEPDTEEPDTTDSIIDPETDEPATDEPATDETTTDEPTTDEITDETITDEPPTDETTADEPTTDEETTDEPTTDESTTDEPTTDEPITDEPITDEPTTDESTTNEPTTDEPTTDEPTTDELTTNEPTTDDQTTVEPTTDEPTTDEPTTEEQTTDEPTTDVSETDEPGTETENVETNSTTEDPENEYDSSTTISITEPTTRTPPIITPRSSDNYVWISLSCVFLVTTIVTLIAMSYFIWLYRKLMTMRSNISLINDGAVKNLPRLAVINTDGDHVIVGVGKN